MTGRTREALKHARAAASHVRLNTSCHSPSNSSEICKLLIEYSICLLISPPLLESVRESCHTRLKHRFFFSHPDVPHDVGAPPGEKALI